MFTVEANQETKDSGEGGLEWAVVGKGSDRDDEEIEEKTKCREPDDNASDDFVDGVEVVGECITEEEESSLEHEG